MNSDILIATQINLLNMTSYLLLKNKNRKKVKKYSAKWLLKTEFEGFSHKLIKEIIDEDSKLYRTILRMTPIQFEMLLEKVSPYLTKQETKMRKPIGAAERLQVTLVYLATGATQSSLQLPFRIQQSTISKILKETIQILYKVLNEDCLKFPETENDWIKISKKFYDIWGFPNCIGAIDGKHCKIKAMKSTASNYWSYKGSHSFILMAIVDAQYQFIYADVGVNGRIGDAGIWLNSDLKYAIEKKEVHIPEPAHLPMTLTSSPYTFVSDDAFPLSDYMMKPYSHMNLTKDERRFNYMLSRSRRVVENAFGILANRFQVLFTPITREPIEAIKVVLACICVHNFLRRDNIKNQTTLDHFTHEEIDSIIQENYVNDNNFRTGSRSKKSAEQIRCNLKEYFKIFKGDIFFEE